MLFNLFNFAARQQERKWIKKSSSYQNDKGNRSNETPDKIVIYMEPATVMLKQNEKWTIALASQSNKWKVQKYFYS